LKQNSAEKGTSRTRVENILSISMSERQSLRLLNKIIVCLSQHFPFYRSEAQDFADCLSGDSFAVGYNLNTSHSEGKRCNIWGAIFLSINLRILSDKTQLKKK